MSKDQTAVGLLSLNRLIHQASLDRLRAQSGLTGLSIEALTGFKDQPDHWMALALTAGPQIRITFKVHFNLNQGKQFAEAIFKRSCEQIGLTQISDFMKEYCNMTVGLIKQVLHQIGHRSSLSLPLLTTNFDVVTFSESSGILLSQDFWKVCSGTHYLTCSTCIELMEPGIDLSNLPTCIPGGESVGDVDFL